MTMRSAFDYISKELFI